jgi:prepilin-type N-terminal cleavage/methylation domain-containing protein
MNKSIKFPFSTKSNTGCHFKFSPFRKGFTLLELLIVMAVLGALASIVLVSYPASQKRARDAKRRSDVKQYQAAMEIYANKNGGVYSVTAATNISGTYCSSTLALPACPDDPKTTQHYTVIATTTTYRIWTTLEQPTSPVTYFYVCSTGEAGEVTTNPQSTNPC